MTFECTGTPQDGLRRLTEAMAMVTWWPVTLSPLLLLLLILYVATTTPPVCNILGPARQPKNQWQVAASGSVNKRKYTQARYAMLTESARSLSVCQCLGNTRDSHFGPVHKWSVEEQELKSLVQQLVTILRINSG